MTEKLSEPLSVKVMDVNDIGVQDIQVEFTVVSGDAFLSTDSLADKFNGQIWVEAESGTLIDPMINSNDGGASGNAYISTPTVNGNYDNGLAKYKIYFPAGGSYNLWLRYYAPDGDQNSCWYAIEGIADTTRWDFTHVYATWAWDAVGPFTIPQGFVDFTIKNREPGTRIDKILFTKNLSYQPSGEGGSSQRFENITDASGIAYTELTFGEQAGQVQVQAYAPSVPNDNTQTFMVSSSATDPYNMDYVDVNKKILYGNTGRQLEEDFSVHVQDKYNNPNNGIPVTFTVVNGDGYFDTGDNTKIAKTVDGIASVRLTLGASAETKVIAELKDYPNISPLDFYGRIPSDELASKIIKTTTATLKGQVKTTLNDSLKVQILNDSDQPVSDYNVSFNVTGGGGTLNGSNTAVIIPTNAGGYAAVAFTLGDTAGVDNQIVQADGSTVLNGAPIIFTASADPGPAAKLVYDSGNNQEQYAGQTFAEPLKVKVTDAYNNGIEGYKVTFRVQNGNGNFAGRTGTTVTNADTTLPTDSLGFAKVSYTAGNVLDLNQVQASASGLSPEIVTFDSLNVLAPQASSILKISGDSPVQEKQVLQTLDSPFKIKVLDTYGNAVSNVDVVFKPKPQADSAKINGQDSLHVQTNAQGEAEATLTLGKMASRQVTNVYVLHQPEINVDFYADADPDPAFRVVAASDTSFNGIAGKDTVTLQVSITDQYNNPVPGYQPVQFYATNGGNFDDGKTFKSATSDNFGKASVKFIMGTNSDVKENIRCTAGLAGSPINFYGTVLPDSANTIAIISGQNQEDKIQSVLAPMVVEVRDKYDNPVTNEPVIFEAFSRGGRFESDSLVVTGEDGRTQVTYRLGTKAGDKSDTVRVSLQNRPEIHTMIYASATPGTAEKIAAVGDTLWQEQLGPVEIKKHPQVKVTDNYDNPVSGIQVVFQPNTGSSVAPPLQNTGTDGTASVTWTLSTSPDTNKVTATAEYSGHLLDGSPVQFMAITKAGNPQDIQAASAQTDTGFTTLKVKVLDENENPVKNQPVMFKIKYPASNGGQFVTGTDTLTVNQKTVYSDENGIAKIGYEPVIGLNSVEARNPDVSYPVNFTIYGVENHATKIRFVNPLPLIGIVDSTISIQIKALDVDDQPVAHQSLSFKIKAGVGSLSSESNTSTDEKGIGRAIWRLGKTAGQDNNVLQVTAKDGSGKHLSGSPMTISATALSGNAFPDSCQVVATDNIVADGTASSAVTITLVDRYGNRVPNKTVTLKSDSADVTFTQPGSATNSLGQAFGSVRSTKADSIYVYAIDINSPEMVLCGTFIYFIHGNASQLQAFAGENQPGNGGAMLKDSLAVLALDQYENPVPGALVQFVVQQGGTFLENFGTSFTANADANGIAFVHFIAGTQVNSSYLVKAQLPGSSASSVSFTAQIREPKAPLSLTNLSSDTLWGQAGELLDEPIRVQVLDVDSIPVANKTIDFELGSGTTGEIINTNPTNYRGIASATYKVGVQSGDHRYRKTKRDERIGCFPHQGTIGKTGFHHGNTGCGRYGRTNRSAHCYN
ncbi:MAG: hypothetical protein GXO75_13975 [Calditrichaeota bacterium]|nr:hypothetical protein [Calditrichota bacterium]